MSRVVTGLDLLVSSPELVGSRPWALLSNHAAVTGELEPARSVLRRAVPGPLLRLLAPEHGLEGVAQDMEAVDDARDPVTGLPVRSLYGHDAATLEPRPEDLDGVATLVVDLPERAAPVTVDTDQADKFWSMIRGKSNIVILAGAGIEKSDAGPELQKFAET